MQRCCFPPALFCIHSWRSTGGRQQLARCPPPPGGALALASFYIGSDHHLTTPSSRPVPCIVCTSQHSFITIKTSAGSCAHYTISGAGSCYLPVRHSSPTRLLRPTGLWMTDPRTAELCNSSSCAFLRKKQKKVNAILKCVFDAQFPPRTVLF